jgi:hypothetical protein
MKTTRVRFVIEVLALVSAIACFLVLFLGTPALGTFAATTGAVNAQSESGQPQSSAVLPQLYEGVVTDTHCGAKHSATVGLSAADCTRACVHSSERFALVDGDKMYVLEGEAAALKRVAGQRAKVSGTLTGNTIAVASVAAS